MENKEVTGRDRTSEFLSYRVREVALSLGCVQHITRLKGIALSPGEAPDAKYWGRAEIEISVKVPKLDDRDRSNWVKVDATAKRISALDFRHRLQLCHCVETIHYLHRYLLYWRIKYLVLCMESTLLLQNILYR